MVPRIYGKFTRDIFNPIREERVGAIGAKKIWDGLGIRIRKVFGSDTFDDLEQEIE